MWVVSLLLAGFVIDCVVWVGWGGVVAENWLFGRLGWFVVFTMTCGFAVVVIGLIGSVGVGAVFFCLGLSFAVYVVVVGGC